MNNRKLNIFTILSVIFLFTLSCRDSYQNPSETGSGEKAHEVFVVQDFWHTGIVFNVKEVDELVWPEIADYSRYDLIDVGWGDEKFYQAEGIPFFLAARAMLWPTQSVLQVFPFNTRLRAAYGPDSRILRIPVTKVQLDELSRYVSESYMRDENGNPLTSTAYGETGYYFLARGKYHVFRTCNTWVAIGFRQSGFDIRSSGVLNANALFRQLVTLPGAEFLE